MPSKRIQLTNKISNELFPKYGIKTRPIESKKDLSERTIVATFKPSNKKTVIESKFKQGRG